MPSTKVLTDLTLVRSKATATIHAPIADVDIAEWLLNLPDAEYQRCAPPDHKAAGASITDDGRPMSINVEEIGGTLLIQHYVAEAHGPHHCRMVSLTDAQTPGGWTHIQVIWDLSVTETTHNTCTYTNTVISYPTQGFIEVLAAAGQDFAAAAADRQQATNDHNSRETAHYAQSLTRAAMGRHYERHGM